MLSVGINNRAMWRPFKIQTLKLQTLEWTLSFTKGPGHRDATWALLYLSFTWRINPVQYLCDF